MLRRPVVWVTLSATLIAPTLAHASGPGDALRLPPPRAGQRYNLAPASRDLRPGAVRGGHECDADYVTAASHASEPDAHDLDADPTSSRVKSAACWVRRAGENEPRAEFTYRLRARGAAASRCVSRRPGPRTSRYDVLVNGMRVVTRGPKPGAARNATAVRSGSCTTTSSCPGSRRATASS